MYSGFQVHHRYIRRSHPGAAVTAAGLWVGLLPLGGAHVVRDHTARMLASAAGDLQSIGSAMAAGNMAAAAPTTGVVPAAADEVSALTAAQFAAHAQLYQAIGAQATAIHELFVNTLGTSAGSYAAAEAANAAAASERQRLQLMDFGALPPEINSARMYAGPGRGRCWPPRRPGTGWPPNCIRRPPLTGR